MTTQHKPECRLSEKIMAAAIELRRPTPQQIDAMVTGYEQALACLDAQKKVADEYKRQLVQAAQRFGEVPAGAEKSHRLLGQLTEITITEGSTVALKDAAIKNLEEAMDANGWSGLFDRMFRARTKYDRKKGAANELRIAELPARLASKFSMMFAACFDVKTKDPSLKITRLADKPVRKPRAKKAVA